MTNPEMVCARCGQLITTGQLYHQVQRATDNYSDNPEHWTQPADLFIAIHVDCEEAAGGLGRCRRCRGETQWGACPTCQPLLFGRLP